MLIAKHIRKSVTEKRPKQNDTLIAALKLVMLNNIFCFADMTFKQLNGTAMGTPPVLPYATIYYGIHEKTFYQNTTNMSYFTIDLSTMYLVFGYPTPIPKPMPICGKNSRTL